jgi:two-component system, LytTR family, sensor kinase
LFEAAKHRYAVWGLLVLACSAMAFCSVFTWYPGSVVQYGVDFRRALTWELLRWNLWLPIAAMILRSKHRFALAYGLLALLFSAFHDVLLIALYFPSSPFGTLSLLRHRAYVLLPDFLGGIVISGLVLGLAHAWREQSRAATLEAQLAQAQLEALKMQLHPHFLFNTLNAIAALQLEDPETARRMVVRLSDFLRATLENSGAREISVDREVDFVSRYLEIERVRFPSTLTVEITIDPETRDALVPNLILQPIVENAIRHGIAAKASGGHVEIRAVRQNGCLQLSVRNTGPGLGAAALRVSGTGRGLAITRNRLERQYGSTAYLSIQNASGGGVEVSIRLPFVTTS